MTSIEGIVEHIIYYNDQNHYTVARLKTGSLKTSVTVVGFLQQLTVLKTI